MCNISDKGRFKHIRAVTGISGGIRIVNHFGWGKVVIGVSACVIVTVLVVVVVVVAFKGCATAKVKLMSDRVISGPHLQRTMNT